jgi:hypothetical protein
MLSTILILGVALSTLVLAWRLIRPANAGIPSLREWEVRKHDLDIQIFRNLVDEGEERYLRLSLSPAEFLFFQRKRTRLALAMVKAVEENTGMLMKLWKDAKMNGEPGVARDADELMGAALSLRLSLFEARLCLYAKWLFPSWTLWVPSWEAKYRDLLGFLVHVQQHQF